MSFDQPPERPDRNLALELVRVTEAAALAAARMVGRGDKEGADQAAVDAMRHVLDSVSMDGVVVIGEGEKDEAPMLFNGEQIGDGTPPLGRHRGRPARGHAPDRARDAERDLGDRAVPSAGRCSTRVRSCTWRRSPAVPRSPTCSTSTARCPRRSALIAERKRIDIRDVMVVMLDRERHHDAMAEIREAGARVRLILDGDVSAALLAVSDNSPVDLLWGIGGTPEGVISAAAIKCIGGELMGRLWPRNDEERTAAIEAGYDLDRVLTCDDLVARRGRVLLGHRRHRRRRAPGRSLPGRPGRDDRVARDALAVGDRAAGLGAPRPREAAGADRHPLRVVLGVGARP